MEWIDWMTLAIFAGFVLTGAVTVGYPIGYAIGRRERSDLPVRRRRRYGVLNAQILEEDR